MGFGIWAGWLYYMELMHGVQKVCGVWRVDCV